MLKFNNFKKVVIFNISLKIFENFINKIFPGVSGVSGVPYGQYPLFIIYFCIQVILINYLKKVIYLYNKSIF